MFMLLFSFILTYTYLVIVSSHIPYTTELRGLLILYSLQTFVENHLKRHWLTTMEKYPE